MQKFTTGQEWAYAQQAEWTHIRGALVVCRVLFRRMAKNPSFFRGWPVESDRQITRTIFAFFGPRWGAGTHTAVLSTVVKQIGISALFPTWPRALSLFSFLALALETVHLIIM